MIADCMFHQPYPFHSSAVATVGFGPTRRKAEPYESSPMTNFGHVAMLDTDVLSFKLWCQLNLMRNIPSLLGHQHYSMA